MAQCAGMTGGHSQRELLTDKILIGEEGIPGGGNSLSKALK